MEANFDPAILDYLWFSVGTLSATTLGFAIAWLRARERVIRAEARAEGLRPGALTEVRFDRLDQSVDALAVELERIAEAERFQSKLLAKRDLGAVSPDRGAREGRVITPH